LRDQRLCGKCPAAVLSVDEVGRLLEAAPGLKHKAALGTVYCAGLRVSEVAALKVYDIGGARMLIATVIIENEGAKSRMKGQSPCEFSMHRDLFGNSTKRGGFPTVSSTRNAGLRTKLRGVCWRRSVLCLTETKGKADVQAATGVVDREDYALSGSIVRLGGVFGDKSDANCGQQKTKPDREAPEVVAYGGEHGRNRSCALTAASPAEARLAARLATGASLENNFRYCN
jgi:hypothetical protein